MSFDANSYLNVNNGKFNPFNAKKDSNNLENEISKSEKSPNEINSTGKCVYGPVNDINSIDTKFARCAPFHSGLFQDFFADNDVDQAKTLVKGIVNASDKGEFAAKVREFYKTINNMDNHELIETAEFLGDQMKNTEGKDDLFGSLLMGVLGELKSRDNQPIYMRDVLKMQKFPADESPAKRLNDELINIRKENSMPQLKFVDI